MVIPINHISDSDLRGVFNAFSLFIDRSEKNGFNFFKEYIYFDFMEEIVSAFDAWLDSYKIEDKILQQKRALMKAQFSANLRRAFFKAFSFVQKETELNPFKKFFHFIGFKRLNKLGKPYIINLLKYIKLLIVMSQAEWQRFIQEIKALSSGLDLVHIDNHPSKLGNNPKLPCNKWRGKIISILGLYDEYPTIEEIKKQDNMFHPHCSHGVTPLTEEETEMALKKRIKVYRNLKRYL